MNRITCCLVGIAALGVIATAADARDSKKGRSLAMPTHSIDTPEHWRHRAEEMRTLADQIIDEKSKQTILRIAEDYEQLSRRAEERANGLPRSK
jgi:hypothetical protein